MTNAPAPTEPNDQPTVGVWSQVLSKRMFICVFTGFASGLPLYLLLQLVPAWLRDSGVSLAEIGLFALVGLPYTWKFLWAPLMDRWQLPLGLRRGWMLFAQVGLILSIGFLGHIDPLADTGMVAAVAVVIAIFSATQDVAIDAYRPRQFDSCPGLPHCKSCTRIAVADSRGHAPLGRGVLDNGGLYAGRGRALAVYF